MSHRRIAWLLSALAVLALAQAPRAAPPGAGTEVLARAGGYTLTGQMFADLKDYGQLLAGESFPAADVAALREGAIRNFQKNPDAETKGYQRIADKLTRQGMRSGGVLLSTVVLARYRCWHEFVQEPQAFAPFEKDVLGQTIARHNPVLYFGPKAIVTRLDAESQLYTEALVAQVAGVAGPTPSDKERRLRELPSRVASLPAQQQEDLEYGELRLANLRGQYEDSVQAHAVIVEDIRRSVHSPVDVWRVARQMEDEGSRPTGRYAQLWRNDKLASIQHAVQFNLRLTVMENALRERGHTTNINTR
jgi:hypothetical protein